MMMNQDYKASLIQAVPSGISMITANTYAVLREYTGGGEMFTGVRYYNYIDVACNNVLYVATTAPIVIAYATVGSSPGSVDAAGVVAAWYDPLARVRRFEGLQGATLRFVTGENALICIWNAQRVTNGSNFIEL